MKLRAHVCVLCSNTFFTGVNPCKTPAYGIKGRVPTALFSSPVY